MTKEERKALVKSYLGKTINIKIDRPIGYVHKKEKYDLVYPINYGYIPDVIGGDSEELDVYLLGVTEPVTECTCRVIGIVYRENDVEDKLIASPIGQIFYQNQIAEAINFQEQYYRTKVESLYERSCGTVLYTVVNDEIHYLLLKSKDNYCGFPKGHMEPGENEKQTALRETWEETSVKATICGDFRKEILYSIGNGKTKSVVYFLAFYDQQIPMHNLGYEHNSFLLLPYTKASSMLTYENAKSVLKEADSYINERYMKQG